MTASNLLGRALVGLLLFVTMVALGVILTAADERRQRPATLERFATASASAEPSGRLQSADHAPRRAPSTAIRPRPSTHPASRSGDGSRSGSL